MYIQKPTKLFLRNSKCIICSSATWYISFKNYWELHVECKTFTSIWTKEKTIDSNLGAVFTLSQHMSRVI